VLLSHSFALSSGDKRTEPLSQSLGITFGYIAVDVFFLTSGFLIASSLVARKNLLGFAAARCLRIYPALVVAVLLTVAVVGCWFTTLTLPAFLSSAETWLYVGRNTTLFTGVAHRLPGAFAETPWPFAVNASLWTLPYEMGMYVLLAGVWWMVARLQSSDDRWLGWAVGGIAVFAMAGHISHQELLSKNAVRLTAMFFTGSATYLFRRRIPVDGRMYAALTVVILASALDRQVFWLVYPLALPYVVFCSAYLPRGWLRQFNRVGDYSYGIYVYAWPVQQMLAASIIGISAWSMLVLSFAATLVLAVLSWHFVEKRALRLKLGDPRE
jgi:peptidoglycan/LPS O-acetylase OafA/YrhL